jgi:hypothetical protein
MTVASAVVGRHRLGNDGAEFDQGGLRPATVEELAAQERATPSSGRKSHRRPVLVALSTSFLLLMGAGAFALARSEQPVAVMIEPYGAAAPFGVGYKDGFGEHQSQPSWSPSPRAAGKPNTNVVSAPPYTPPVPSAPPSLGLIEEPEESVVLSTTGTPKPSTSKPSTPKPATTSASAAAKPPTSQTKFSAVYWDLSWRDKYWVYVWVHNDGNSSADWQVQLGLPKKAQLSHSWEVRRADRGEGNWTFTSTRGSLKPGRTYLFAIEGSLKDGPFTLQSCKVNGIACVPFR